MERTANWHRYVKELQLDGNECVLLKVLLILSLSKFCQFYIKFRINFVLFFRGECYGTHSLINRTKMDLIIVGLDDASASERALLTSHSESYAKIIFSYVMARRGREQVCRQNSNLSRKNPKITHLLARSSRILISRDS